MTSEDFKKLFSLPDTFSPTIAWSDGVGFSTIQDFDANHASIYKVGIHNQDLNNKIMKLWISVSYGKKVKEGISLGTEDQGFNKPVDLDYMDDFTYDSNLNKFYNKSEEINPNKIILDIEKIHKLPTKKIRGAVLRLRLYVWRKLLPSLIIKFDKILICLLLLVSGEKPIESDVLKRWATQWTNEWQRGIVRENEQISKTTPEFKLVSFNAGELLNFYIFKAKRWSLFFIVQYI